MTKTGIKLKIAALFVLTACAVTLCSCGKTGVHYEAQDYMLSTEYTSDFRILQLTDIHLGVKDDQAKQMAYMDTIITDSDCDFIVVTGDIFTYADRTTAKRFFNFLDSYGVPWTVCFGNHDEQCYFSIDWLTNYLNNFGSNCLFKDLQDDDVFGNCNFVINLTKDGSVFEQIFIMDSNRYHYGYYIGYDYIKQDQIDWYQRMVEYSTQQNGGQVVPSILFCHIPVPEVEDAWEAAQTGDSDVTYIYGEQREDVSAPEYNSGFFDKVLEMGSTRGMFFGHDHVSDFIVKYQGVYLGYGLTSTDRVYGDADMMGGRIIVIHDDHSLSFESQFHTYDEVM